VSRSIRSSASVSVYFGENQARRRLHSSAWPSTGCQWRKERSGQSLLDWDAVIVALDAHYRQDDSGRVAAVAFHDWTDSRPAAEYYTEITHAEPYRSGRFYLRELPGLLEIIEKVGERPEMIVVDGYAWLGKDRPGLGARLWEALDRSVPVIGVAKSSFKGAPALEVEHGGSWRHLYVTAAGVDQEKAAEAIRSMHGGHYMPELLRRADRLARTGGL
jgi:deoxyribonuclease V